MEDLRSNAKIIQDASFDAAELPGDDDVDYEEEEMDPETKALWEGESSNLMNGTRCSSNNNDNHNMLMTSYSVSVTETMEQPARSASSSNIHEKNSTSTTSRNMQMQRQASSLIRPHREFVRSNSGLETTKTSRVERSWLMLAESNRIGEIGEKIFFRYVGQTPLLSKKMMIHHTHYHCIHPECSKITPT
jgi:hypothetical protein